MNTNSPATQSYDDLKNIAEQIQGWNNQVSVDTSQTPPTLIITKGNITYTIEIPVPDNDKDAYEALKQCLKKMEELSNAGTTLVALPFANYSRQFSYTMKIENPSDSNKTILLHSNAASPDGYTPYVEFDGHYYGETVDGRMLKWEISKTNALLGLKNHKNPSPPPSPPPSQTNTSLTKNLNSNPQPSALKHSTSTEICNYLKKYALKSSSDASSEGITDVTYDASLSRQFQNPNDPDQNIDGEQIARTLGIPYQHDMVFQIFDQLNDKDKAQFIVNEEQKEELTPEQKFEYFRRKRYKYADSLVTIEEEENTLKVADQHTLSIPTKGTLEYSDFCMLLSSIESEQLRKKEALQEIQNTIKTLEDEQAKIADSIEDIDEKFKRANIKEKGVLSEQRNRQTKRSSEIEKQLQPLLESKEHKEELLKLINIYGYKHTYSSKLSEKVSFQKISSFQIHEIMIDNNRFEYFIAKINASSEAQEFFKISSDKKLSQQDIEKKIKFNEAVYIAPDYIEIFISDGKEIDIQKMSAYLNTPIINVEHAFKIYSFLTPELQSRISTQCLFDSSIQAKKSAEAHTVPNSLEELKMNFLAALQTLHHKPDGASQQHFQKMCQEIKLIEFENTGHFALAWGRHKNTKEFNEDTINSLIQEANNLIQEANKLAGLTVAPTAQKGASASLGRTLSEQERGESQKKFIATTSRLLAAVQDEKLTTEQQDKCQVILHRLLKLITPSDRISSETIENAANILSEKLQKSIGVSIYEKLERLYTNANNTLNEIYLDISTKALTTDIKTAGAKNVIAINRIIFLDNLSLHAAQTTVSSDCMLAAKPIFKLIQDGRRDGNKFATKEASDKQKQELLKILVGEGSNRNQLITEFFEKDLFTGMSASLMDDIPKVAEAIASRSEKDRTKNLAFLQTKYEGMLSTEELALIFSSSEINKQIRKMSESDKHAIKEELIREYAETGQTSLKAELVAITTEIEGLKTKPSSEETVAILNSRKESLERKILLLTNLNVEGNMAALVEMLPFSQTDSNLLQQKTVAKAMQANIRDFIKSRKNSIAEKIIKLFDDVNPIENTEPEIAPELVASKENLVKARKKQLEFSKFLLQIKKLDEDQYRLIREYLSMSSESKESFEKQFPDNLTLKEAFDSIKKITEADPKSLLFMKLLLSDAFACPDVRLYLLNSLDKQEGTDSRKSRPDIGKAELRQELHQELLNKLGARSVNNSSFIALQEIGTMLESLGSQERQQLSLLIKNMSSSYGNILDDSVVKDSAADFSECADYYKLLAHALYTPFPKGSTAEKQTEIINSMIQPFLSGTAGASRKPLLIAITEKIISLRKDGPESLVDSLHELSKIFSTENSLVYNFSSESSSKTGLTPFQNIQGVIHQPEFWLQEIQKLDIVSLDNLLEKVLQSKEISLDNILSSIPDNSEAATALKKCLSRLIADGQSLTSGHFLKFIKTYPEVSFENCIALSDFLFNANSKETGTALENTKKRIIYSFISQGKIDAIFSKRELKLIQHFVTFAQSDNPNLSSMGKAGLQKVFNGRVDDSLGETTGLPPIFSKDRKEFMAEAQAIENNPLITSALEQPISEENFKTLMEKYKEYFTSEESPLLKFEALDDVKKKVLGNCFNIIMSKNASIQLYKHEAFAICVMALHSPPFDTVITEFNTKLTGTGSKNETIRSHIKRAINILEINQNIDTFISPLKIPAPDSSDLLQGTALATLINDFAIEINPTCILAAQPKKIFSRQHLSPVEYKSRPKAKQGASEGSTAPTFENFTPSISVMPVMLEPAKANIDASSQSRGKKSSKRQSESEPTSALTKRLTSLLDHIAESTHPSVLLNDLLHHKKPSSDIK